jgi:hypothetical protein
MKNEIDKTHYCAGDFYSKNKGCYNRARESDAGCIGTSCGCYHYKWPTPKQYKAEYGEEWPGDCAVYIRSRQLIDTVCDRYFVAKRSTVRNLDSYIGIICACTPWGKPPDEWRPE